MRPYRIFILLIALSIISLLAEAQGERKYIRQGNKEYNEGEFNESEIHYRKALNKDINSYEGNFNLGDALYKQEKYEDAARKFSNITDPEMEKQELSRIYHNLGNSLLKNNQLQESIEAYKQALRNNPDDPDTKHNLAYAMNMLQQQQQQQNQENQDENQDQQDKEQQNNEQKQEEQEQEQQQEQQEQQQQQGEQEEQQQQQQQKDQITEEDARRMLEALQQDEQQLQEKLKKQKAKAQRIAVIKDW